MARILVVDDENNIRMMVRLALQHVGHTVETAADGPEGSGKVRQRQQLRSGPVGSANAGNGRDGRSEADALSPSARENHHGNRVRHDRPGCRSDEIGRDGFSAQAFHGGNPARSRPIRLTRTVPNTEHGGTSNVSDGVTFGSTTINGFRIEFQAGPGEQVGGEFRQKFTVRSPAAKAAICAV